MEWLQMKYNENIFTKKWCNVLFSYLSFYDYIIHSIYFMIPVYLVYISMKIQTKHEDVNLDLMAITTHSEVPVGAPKSTPTLSQMPIANKWTINNTSGGAHVVRRHPPFNRRAPPYNYNSVMNKQKAVSKQVFLIKASVVKHMPC